MIQQYSTVSLTKDIPDSDVAAGSMAVVVEVHSEPSLGYEIEVVANDGSTLFLGAVSPDMVVEVNSDCVDPISLPSSGEEEE